MTAFVLQSLDHSRSLPPQHLIHVMPLEDSAVIWLLSEECNFTCTQIVDKHRTMPFHILERSYTQQQCSKSKLEGEASRCLHTPEPLQRACQVPANSESEGPCASGLGVSGTATTKFVILFVMITGRKEHRGKLQISSRRHFGTSSRRLYEQETEMANQICCEVGLTGNQATTRQVTGSRNELRLATTVITGQTELAQSYPSRHMYNRGLPRNYYTPIIEYHRQPQRIGV